MPICKRSFRAADKSWELGFGYIFHGRVAFWPGDQQDAGPSNRTDGEFFARRNRPSFDYRWNKGFYQLFFQGDFDSGGDPFAIQRSTFFVHFERLNPWLPRFHIGMDNPGLVNLHDSNFGSSSSGHLERSMLVRSTFGVNTGGSTTGFGLTWRRVPLGQGDATFVFTYIQGQGVGDGEGTDSDRKDFGLYIGGRPFTKIKNKWVKGIDFGVGFRFANNDTRADEDGERRIRIRDHRMVAADGDGNENRIVLFNSGNVGDGYQNYISPGLGWRIGPYRLRVALAWARAEDKFNLDAGAKRGSMFSIANELFVWSKKKGLFTGSANGPHSVMLSWLFERDNGSCRGSGSGVAGFCNADGEFNRNRVLLRELDLWYFIRRNLSVGVSWLWYDAANVLAADQSGIGCSRNNATRPGKDCDWHNVVLGLRVGF